MKDFAVYDSVRLFLIALLGGISGAALAGILVRWLQSKYSWLLPPKIKD